MTKNKIKKREQREKCTTDELDEHRLFLSLHPIYPIAEGVQSNLW